MPHILLQLERVITMQLAQEIFTVLIVNTPTVTLLLFIFGIYKKKVEQTEKEVKEIKTNYLDRFGFVQELIEKKHNDLMVKLNDDVMVKLGELSKDVAVMQSRCYLIQDSKKKRIGG